MLPNINWALYGAVSCVNLISLVGGVAYAWTSPTLPRLKNKNDLSDNPFGRPITPFEESWITSIISIGASVGPFLAVLLVDRIGRKRTLLLLAPPMITSHLILAFTSDLNLYYFSRFILGLAVGCVYSIIPIYVGEIAEDTNRGAYGCFLTIICTIGTVFCYVVGPFLTIKLFCLILVIPCVAFLILFGWFVPESPYYLLMENKFDDAKVSLKKLRNTFDEKELEDMQKNVEISKLHLKDSLKSKAIKRGLLIGCGLIFFQQCSGITVILSYMQSIFEATGTKIQPEVSAIIVGSLQLLANAMTSQLVDRLGRKILLLSSLIGGFLSHTLLGIYFYLQVNNFVIITYLFWLPICCLILYVVVFMSGLGPVTWAMLGELFPPHFRNYASTLTSSFCQLLAFLLTFFFPNLNKMIGMAFSFWIFATSCAIGIIFVWKMVPETKGKSLHEIQIILKR